MLRALISCLLLLSSGHGFSSDQGLRTPVGILYSASHTKLNGNKVPQNLPVFEDDTVESSGSENARVSLGKNVSVLVVRDAAVTLHDHWVQLRSGTASVSTSTRYTLKNDCFSAQPDTTTQTLFTAGPYDGRIYIYAEKGTVTVKARKEMRVPEGKTIAISNCGRHNEAIAFASPDHVPEALMLSGAAWGTFIVIWKMSGEEPDEKKADQ